MDSFFSGIRATFQDAFSGAPSGSQRTRTPAADKILAGWERKLKNMTLGQHKEVLSLLTNLSHGEVSEQDKRIAQTVFNTLIRDQEYAVFADVFEKYNAIERARYPVDENGVSSFKSTLVLQLPKDFAPASEPVYGGTAGLDTDRSPIWSTFSKLHVDQLVVRAAAPGDVVSTAACTLVASLLSSDNTSELIVHGTLAQPEYLADVIEDSKLISAELGGVHQTDPAERFGYRRLMDGMSGCASFQHLTLATTAVENAPQVLYKFGMPACRAKLATLNVVGSPLLLDENGDVTSDLKQIVDIAKNIKTLSTFVLYASVQGLDALSAQVLAPLTHHPSLVHLEIRGEPKTPSVGQEANALVQLLEFSTQCPALRNLTWARVPGSMPRSYERTAPPPSHYRNDIGAAEAAMSSVINRPQFKLAALTIGGTLLSSIVLDQFFAKRQSDSTLEFLDLRDCQLDREPVPQVTQRWESGMPTNGLLLPGGLGMGAQTPLTPLSSSVTTTNNATVITNTTTRTTTSTGTVGIATTAAATSAMPVSMKHSEQIESVLRAPKPAQSATSVQPAVPLRKNQRPQPVQKTPDEVLAGWTKLAARYQGGNQRLSVENYEKVRLLLVHLAQGLVSLEDEMEVQSVFNALVSAGEFEVFADVFETYNKVQRDLHPQDETGASTFKSSLTLQLPRDWAMSKLSVLFQGDPQAAMRSAFGRIQVDKLVVVRPHRSAVETDERYSWVEAPEDMNRLMGIVLKQGRTTELVLHGAIGLSAFTHLGQALEDSGLQSVELGLAAPIYRQEPPENEQSTYNAVMRSLVSCGTLRKLTLSGRDVEVASLDRSKKLPIRYADNVAGRQIEFVAAVQANDVYKVSQLRSEGINVADVSQFATSFEMASLLLTPFGKPA